MNYFNLMCHSVTLYDSCEKSVFILSVAFFKKNLFPDSNP